MKSIKIKSIISWAAALIGITCTGIASTRCTTPAPLEERVSSESVEASVGADNLYFYRATNYLTNKELEYIAERVNNNFRSIGITFKSVQVIEGQNFPPLRELDILMYVVDAQVSGQFGIDNHDRKHNDLNPYLYDKLKKAVLMPYDITTSEAHLGVIDPAYVPPAERHHGFNGGLRELCRQGHENAAPEQEFRYIIQVATHEIAHGLGAAHLLSGQYMMSFRSRNCNRDIYFDSGNIGRMKQFIPEVKEKEYSDEELIQLRQGYLRRIFKPGSMQP